MADVSPLPSVMRNKLTAMQEEPSTDPAAPVETPATPETPATAPEGERVTLSRAEFNELQGAAGRAETAAGRSEAAKDRITELEARLTELSTKVKGEPESAPPSTTTAPAVQYTEDELRDFGDSKGFIGKVVSETLGGIVKPLHERIAALESKLDGLATTTQRIGQSSFSARLQSKVVDMATIIGHKNWQDFLDAVEPMTGATYEHLLRSAVTNERTDAAANIYNKFKQLYITEGGSSNNGGAYAGLNPSQATTAADEPQTQGKLKVSDRKKASEDYRKGRITWDKLQEVHKAFDEADAKGNIDYNQ